MSPWLIKQDKEQKSKSEERTEKDIKDKRKS